MFPNIRLIVAAITASVLALSCGFAVFAALRVNHEPLARLSSATAPLQLVADTAAPGEPFNHRFPVGELQIAGGATDSPVRKVDRSDGGESPSAVSAAMPQPVAADAGETEAVGQPTDQPVQPVTSATTPTADDHAAGASEPESAPAATDGAGLPTSLQKAEVPEAEGEARPDGSAETTGEPAPATTPAVAAIESPTDQALPVEQTTPETEIAPASPTSEAIEATPGTAKNIVRKKAAHTRVAARTSRSRRLRHRAVARFDTLNLTLPQPHFLSAPQAWQTQAAQTQPARVRRLRITSRKTAKRSSSVGGPFASPTSQ